jgi:tRNA nucleotidyltransferase (CCA-adding enzyme)
MDVLARLRDVPGAAALDALTGEDGVHVVGGAVRDVLLGREPRELDFVVVGDAGPVARRAAARLGGEAVVHDRFGTATVRAPAATFDVVSARRERYGRPGALPDVELGAALADDLARRDFTVNAIAVGLADGALSSVEGALEDLDARRLRVLHDRSFLDDPTRMLRLARYAARLGFRPDRETDALAAAAAAGGAVATVTGPRLGAELRLALAEPQPAALLAAERHGLAAAAVHPGFAVRPEVVDVAMALCPPGARADLTALAACCVAVPGPDLAAALDRLEFDARERGIVTAAATSAGRLGDAIADAAREGRTGADALWRVLRRELPESVALMGAVGGPAAESAARWWLEDLRHRRLAIDGDDLVAAGLSGPPVGRALEAAAEAMYAGAAPGREEQLAVALAAVGGR